MARPRKTEAPDLSARCELTVGAIERLTCPPGRDQAFLRDAQGNGLKVRVSPSGAKTFVFEQRLRGRTVRRAIGDVRTWTIAEAQREAKRLSLLVDGGIDPRELAREQNAARAAAAAAEIERAQREAADQAARAVTFGDAWSRYLADRRPHWGERNYSDHVKAAHPGGIPRLRRKDVLTQPGPLAALMPMRLADLNAAAVEQWAARESATRPARVRLALRQLKAFLRWANAEPEFKGRIDLEAANAKRAREAAGRAKPKDDVLLREQLRAWFAHVRAISNPTISAYLQTLLLTGARREELAALRWEDLNWSWKGIEIRDKVEGRRTVPLTPYVASLLGALPRRNEWVFASARVVSLDPKHVARRARYHAKKGTEAPPAAVVAASATGRLVEPSIAHRAACAAAGIESLTLHGLRRSFASLTEWLDIPAGVVAQIMGHKPSATAEKHYKRRPLDLLRVHHERIEAWILQQAGISFSAPSASAPQLGRISG